MKIICPHCGNVIKVKSLGEDLYPVVEISNFFNIEIPDDLDQYLKDNLSDKTYLDLIFSKDLSWLNDSIKEIFIFDLEDYIIKHIENGKK